MKAYTAYPLKGHPGVTEIEVLSYDRDKYCTVRYNGVEDEIKRGYVWKDPALTKRFTDIHWMLLPRNSWEAKPTRLQAHQELKKTYRSKKTDYFVYLDGRKKIYGNLKAALSAFASSNVDGWVTKCLSYKCGFSTGCLVERENSQLYVISDLSEANWKLINKEIK